MDMDITSTIFIVLITITTEQLMDNFFDKEIGTSDSKGIMMIILFLSFLVAGLLVLLPQNEAWKFLIRGTNLPSPIANWYTRFFGSVLSLSLLTSLFAYTYYKLIRGIGFRLGIQLLAFLALLLEIGYLYLYWQFILDPNQVVTNGTLQQLSIRALEQAIAFFYHFAFLGIFFLIANVSLAIDCYLDSI